MHKEINSKPYLIFVKITQPKQFQLSLPVTNTLECLPIKICHLRPQLLWQPFPPSLFISFTSCGVRKIFVHSHLKLFENFTRKALENALKCP